MSIAKEVRTALYAGDLFLEYLPIVSLADERCVGCEALIRWRRGSRIVPPLEFIPQIENTPVSGLVTYWVIDRLAAELAAWLRAHDGVYVSFNVPPEILGRGGMEYAAAKAEVLDLASKIVLEITERGVPDQLGVDAINSRELRERYGVRIALDDVCANNYGLFVASQVNVDILKVEKATIDQLTDQSLSSREMLALSLLIRDADTTMVAEGVETDAQAGMLRSSGFGFAQGWRFSRPLSAADFMGYCAARC